MEGSKVGERWILIEGVTWENIMEEVVFELFNFIKFL